MPDLIAQLAEPLGAEHVEAARPRQADHDAFDDAPRPRSHDQHLVGEIDRLDQTMGDEQDGRTAALLHAQKLFPHPRPRLLVERAERLVHQQQARIADEAAGNGDALLHAAGQFVREAAREIDKPDKVEQFHRPGAPFGRRHAAERQREFDILRRRLPRQQQRLLKDDADLVGARTGDRLAVDANLPARRRVKPADDLHQRGFSAAARPHHRHELPLAD